MIAAMRRFPIILLLMLALVGCASRPSDRPLEVGLAAGEITPPVGYRLAGYFFERLATDVHDPLYAKAIVFKQGDTAFALVICDLCQTSPAVVAQARTLASQKTGIPTDHICICATHTHTGPDYFGVLAEHLHQLALSAHAGEDPAQTMDYPNFLAEKIAGAVVAAHASAAPARLSVGSAAQPNIAFNRRYVMKDGTVAWNPGKKNPNIDHPAGPIDPRIAYLWVTRPGKTEPAAILTNFALHPDTVGGTEFSADFPYYLEAALHEIFSREVISIFAQGASGNINHVDVSTDRPQKGFDEAQRIGAALAGQAVKEPGPVSIDSPRLGVATTRVDLPLQQFTPQEVAAARALFAKIQERKLPFLVGVRAAKIVKVYDRYHGQPISAQIQAIRLNEDTAIVMLPSELFVEFGLAIKSRSPFGHTFVIELANDSFGYIPTQKAFEEGAYEPTNSTIAPGGGERLVEAALQLLERLKS